MNAVHYINGLKLIKMKASRHLDIQHGIGREKNLLKLGQLKNISMFADLFVFQWSLNLFACLQAGAVWFHGGQC